MMILKTAVLIFLLSSTSVLGRGREKIILGDPEFLYTGTPKSPSLSFHLGDRMFRNVVLERFDILNLGEKEGLCHFIGKTHDGTTVGVTGCPGKPDVQITVASKDLTAQYMLDDKSLIEKEIPSPWDDPKVKTAGPLMNETSDEIFLAHLEKMVNSVSCSGDCSIPSLHKMRIKIGYDSSLASKVKDPLPWISGVMTHAQTFFYDSSLPTKIKLEIIEMPKFYPNDVWRAETSVSKVTKYARGEKETDHYVFLCADRVLQGTVGISYVGGLCSTNGYQVSINEWRTTEAATAKVVAHEMGHNMGMSHDFDDKHKGKDCTGIMDYGHSKPNTWSACSQEDFKNHYFGIIQSGKEHCMEVLSKDVMKPSGSLCKQRKYIGDGYCDDDNNFKDCDFDGGDCCNNTNKNWNRYCKSCECKQDCKMTKYIGDRYCDDENNNPGCNFDGGDCCNHSFKLWNKYCKECKCKE